MAKSWSPLDKTESMCLATFTYPGSMYVAGAGSNSGHRIHADMPVIAEGMTDDPLDGADGSLA